MALNKYLSIITLNINGLNNPIKRHRIAQKTQKTQDKKTWPTHKLPTGDPPQNKRPTHTESKGLETNIPSKRTGKKSQSSNTHIRQNRLQNKGHKKKPRKTLHKTQGKSPSRRHKNYKYICTQHNNTQIYKENLGELQERYWQQHDYSKRC